MSDEQAKIQNTTSIQDLISQFEKTSHPINTALWDQLTYLRRRPRKKRNSSRRENFNQPVAVFSKPDRLKSGLGTEITLIMRSKACSWAHSQSGGCSMCGYWNDRADLEIQEENYWNQFSKSIERNQKLLENPEKKIVFKIFTSGSFCDSNEISVDIQTRILRKLCSFPTIKEIVIESRPEYITSTILDTYHEICKSVYLEFGIGLESGSDYLRTNLINKGFPRDLFEKKVSLLHTYGFGVKAYVLFKPPFLNEYSALFDLRNTISYCKKVGVDTISVNPTNIQTHTICEELWKEHGFRSPWLFSLLSGIKSNFSPEDLSVVRVICDPSAKGKERGVHNCNGEKEENMEYLHILEKFVELQNPSVIPDKFRGSCYENYVFNLFYGNL